MEESEGCGDPVCFNRGGNLRNYLVTRGLTNITMIVLGETLCILETGAYLEMTVRILEMCQSPFSIDGETGR